MRPDLLIRPAAEADRGAIWGILESVLRPADAFALPRDMSRAKALAYWLAPGHVAFVAESEGRIAGTYFLRANQKGGGDHVANAAYATDPALRSRGIARAMAEHSFAQARSRGFLAMQFNFVVSANEGAVHLWRSLGFEIVGRLPGAFRHPQLGYIDAFVMFRPL